jgi:hypothetical protein
VLSLSKSLLINYTADEDRAIYTLTNINIGYICNKIRSRDSVVSIATGYGLDDRGVGVRVPVESRIFSLLHVLQNDSGAHPASYPMGTGGSFPGGKASGA